MTRAGTDTQALTRRRVLAMTVAAPVAGTALPALGQGGGVRDAITGGDLAAALKDVALPHRGAKLHLVSFSAVLEPHRQRLDAVIALDWAPGRRQRRMTAEGPDGALALSRLLEDVRAMMDGLSKTKLSYGE